jgi:cytochrome c oxidase subunit II
VKKRLILISAIALMIGLSACGDKKDESSAAASPAAAVAAGDAQQLTINASNWKFDQAEYKVKKGQPVTVTLKNAEGVHGVELEKLGVKLEGKNLTKTFTADKAGKYNIVCTIPCGTDHLKMKAVLIVEE